MKIFYSVFLTLSFLFVSLSSVTAQTSTLTPALTKTLTATPASRGTNPTRRPTTSVTRTPALTGRANQCAALQNVVKNRAENTARYAENLIAKFEAITKRVDDFYKTKNVPAGKTVSNYDQLMTQITTNRDKVKTAVAKAKATLASFDCNNNPRNTMQQFKADMHGVVAALKTYKTSVRNLIVAVHRVTPDTTISGTPSVTRPATPSATKAVTATPTL